MTKQERISIWEAIELVQQYRNPLPVLAVEPTDALGMVLAEPVYTQIDQPPYPRSAMDGYAICAGDSVGASQTSPISLRVVGTQYAGDPYFRPLVSGEALRIMTGAAIPPGANAVVKQEDTDYGDALVSIYKEAKANQNYCPIGEDFPLGAQLGEAGDTIDAYFIAAAVAAGIETLPVRRKLCVGILTTGSELQLPGQPLREGKIYDSNLALLSVRLRQLGCQVSMAIASEDTQSKIQEQIQRMADTCDLILTTGGVSVGLKDLMPNVMEALGADVLFHGIAVKPGMPTMFSVYQNTPILSLSGNPYAAAAMFELLIKPCIAGFTGSNDTFLKKVEGIALDDYTKEVVCDRFLRATYDHGEISFSGQQKNGQTKAGIGSNCMVYCKKGQSPIHKGDNIEAYLLYSYMR